MIIIITTMIIIISLVLLIIRLLLLSLIIAIIMIIMIIMIVMLVMSWGFGKPSLPTRSLVSCMRNLLGWLRLGWLKILEIIFERLKLPLNRFE